MNVKVCLDVLMARLGNRTSPILRENCLREMSLIQEKLEQSAELPWFLESEQAEILTTPFEQRLPYPSDFIREKEDFNLVRVDTDGAEVDLIRRNYDEAEIMISRNAQPGVPQMYYPLGEYIILRPTPDDVYTIRFPTYYAKQEPPSDTVDSHTAWFKHVPDLFIDATGVIIASAYLKDPSLVAVFGGNQASAENRLVRLMTAKEEENRSRRMG